MSSGRGTLSLDTCQHWDTRFTNFPRSFDWLVPPSTIIPPLLAAISPHTSSDLPSLPSSLLRESAAPRILRIGCGTSGLSNLLRSHVPPWTILNVDVSHRAIELGVQRERDEFPNAGKEAGQGSTSWARADLLDLQSINSAIGRDYGNGKPIVNDCGDLDAGYSMPSTVPANPAKFSIVIEKSCAGSIACGEDVTIKIPYRFSATEDCAKDDGGVVHIHPVRLLAIHLAALTKEEGMWVALSYSESRFDCLYEEEGGDESFREMKWLGLVPDPAMLWTVVKK